MVKVKIGQLIFEPEYKSEFPDEETYCDIPSFYREKDGKMEFWPIPNTKQEVIIC